VEKYERETGKQAKNRQLEIWKQQGIEVPASTKASNGPRGYND
jgi:sulfonate dioxygenase